MIISTNEFKELGFSFETKNQQLLENCIKRAEYILNAICGGTLASAMAQSKSNASLIKQAAAFEANALLKAELKEQRAERWAEQQLAERESRSSSNASSTNSNSSTHFSIGDVSFTESSGSGSSTRESNSTANGSSGGNDTAEKPFDISRTVERLLRAAGCVPYTAAEVIE